MKQFNNYLNKKNFAENTAKMYRRYVLRFTQFIESENLEPKEVRYNDVLAFIEELRKQERSTGNINRHLIALRHYYNSLETDKNPAEGIVLKGTLRKIPDNLLSEKELKQVYENHPNKSNRDKRNKIILGLLVNQAVSTEELHKLKPEHLLLKTGKIKIPGGKRSNARTLKLEAEQIMELYNYLEITGPEIIKNIHEKRPARKPNKINTKRINEQLFISINGDTNLKPSLYHLFRTLKKKHPNIQNAKQIRMSVITNKLKTQNLREVQYFAGHRYVSSTERYRLNNIENLKKETDKYHPLNKTTWKKA